MYLEISTARLGEQPGTSPFVLDALRFSNKVLGTLARIQEKHAQNT
jgi:hypothetical protein